MTNEQRITQLREAIERIQAELEALVESQPERCTHCWGEYRPAELVDGECERCRETVEDPEAEHRAAYIADCIGGCR